MKNPVEILDIVLAWGDSNVWASAGIPCCGFAPSCPSLKQKGGRCLRLGSF